MFCSEVDATAVLRRCRSDGSGLGGKQTWRPEHNGMTAVAKTTPAQKSLSGTMRESRPISPWGRPKSCWEATGKSTARPAVTEVLASKERLAEITSGRANSQQGLATTCKDPPYRAVPEIGGRDLVRRMSPYERRRRGNSLPGGSRGRPRQGNSFPGQRGSGHLAAPGRRPDTEPGYADPRSEGELVGKPARAGAYVGQHLSFATVGKAREGKPRSEPDSGNPTVRDRREALGTVAHGGIVIPPRNRKGGSGNPPPTRRRAQDLSRPRRPAIELRNHPFRGADLVVWQGRQHDARR